MNRSKQERVYNRYDDDDDDDADDYENANPLSIAPAVPSREERKKNDALKDGLALKCVKINEKEPVWTIPQKGSSQQAASRFHPPPLGLDFSSGVVNAAFEDIADARCSSDPVNKAFRHLEGIPYDKSQKKPSQWKKVGLVLVWIFIFILVVLTVFVFLRYFAVSKALAGLMHNVSDLQLNAELNQKNLKTEFTDISAAIGGVKSSLNQINKTLESLCHRCPSGWRMENSACYFLSEDTKSWDMAQQECNKVDSDLLIARDFKEMNSLKPFFKNNRRYWIGLKRDPQNIHIWKWLDGTQLNFNNWEVNEPNYFRNQEHCGETVSGPWNDRNCVDSVNYICKKSRSCQKMSVSEV